jgi:DNA-binding GntR family transcriptional regulator
MDDSHTNGTAYSVADRVYQLLRQQIISGDIPPRGAVQEAAITRLTGASRTPVREALRRLEAENLISRSPTGAYSVTELSVQELMDIYELRGILEGHAARLAADRRGRVELARLADVVDAMAAAIHDHDDERLNRLNGTFHDLIAESSGSRYLQNQIRSIREHFERYRLPALSVPGRREEAHLEHDHLMQAIKDQDADAAERIARDHVREASRLRLSGTTSDQRAEVTASR